MIESTLVLAQLIPQFDIKSSVPEDRIVWQIEGTMKPTNYECCFVPRN